MKVRIRGCGRWLPVLNLVFFKAQYSTAGKL